MSVYQSANNILERVKDEEILEKLKNVDGDGSGLDADLVRGVAGNLLAKTDLSNVDDSTILDKLKNISGFCKTKNKIINSSFDISQRGEIFVVCNEGKYTLDRCYVSSQNCYSSVIRHNIYATDNNLKDQLDIFNDGSCIALYKFNSNVTDESGNHNGNVVGTITYKSGIFDEAVYFNGDNNNYVGTNLLLYPGYSISFWANGHGGYYNVMGASNSDDNGNNWNIGTRWFNGGYCDAYAKGAVTDDVWVHTVFVFNSNDIRDLQIYINGIEFPVHVVYSNNHIRNDGDNYIVFGKDVRHNNAFNGLLDQVRVFNRPITSDEVRILYTESNNYKTTKRHFFMTQFCNTSDNFVVHPFVYRFEGRDLYNEATSGKTMTLSFKFASNKNGEFSFSFRDTTNHVADSYIHKFIYSNAPEFSLFSFPIKLSDFPDRTVNDVNKGFEIIIGSNNKNYEAPTEGLFTNIDYHYLKDTNQWSENDWFRLMDLQLEEGENYTGFYYVDPFTELMRCYRYYQYLDVSQACASWVDPTQVLLRVTPIVKMRTAPTVESYHFTYWTGTSVKTINVNSISPTSYSILCNLAEPVDRGQGSSLPIYLSSYIILDAEL